jgi:hypothetical protein
MSTSALSMGGAPFSTMHMCSRRTPDERIAELAEDIPFVISEA